MAGSSLTMWAVAGSITVLLALLDAILSLVLMLYHVCALETDGKNEPDDYSFFHYFYVNYLAGDSCEYNNLLSTADPDDYLSKPAPYWPVCTGEGEAAVRTTPVHDYTDPEATFIWTIVYLVLAVLWLLSGVALLLGFFSGKSRSVHLAYPWVAMTAIMLVYGMMAACVYMTDLSIPLDYKDCDDSANYGENLQSKTLQSVMVLPMFFARGFIVWFLLLALLLLFIKVVLFAREEEMPRSLSAYENEIPAVVQEEPPPPVMAKAVPVLALAAASERINESFEDDRIPTPQPAPQPQPLQQPLQHAIPPAYGPYPQARQPSQLHMANQPPVIVPLPATERRPAPRSPPPPTHAASGEFVLPRARADRSSYYDRYNSRQSKPVRTPSGREVSAEEYLREYRPVRRRNSRDEDDVERYFVRLKD